jgi:uncharacterized protein
VTSQAASHGSVDAGAGVGVEVEVEARIAAMPFARVLELPRIVTEDAQRDVTLPQRLAALAGAYLLGDAVAFGWHRASAGGVVQITVGGDALIESFGRSGARELEVSVNLPPGSRGEEVKAAALSGCYESLAAWTRVCAVVDALSMQAPCADAQRTAAHSPSLEETITTAWREPFAWLALAVPVDQAEVQRQAKALARSIPLLRSRASNSEEHAVNLARDEARYRELLRAELQGLWDVHLLVGAADAGAAARFAALLCASIDLSALLYTLRPAKQSLPYNEALSVSPAANEQGASPFAASTELLAALAVPPRHELAGIRLRQRPTFDLTPETGGEIRLGTIVDSAFAGAGSMNLSEEALKRHTFVCGATGSGKSQTVRHVLETLTRHDGGAIPWLVVEPAKAEYRNLAGRLEGEAEVIALTPGKTDVAPAGINPLEPEKGFPLQTHVDLTHALFLAAFRTTPPFPQVIGLALTRVYEDFNWDLTLGEARGGVDSATYPRLGDLQRVARDVVSDIGYGEEATRDVRGFVDVRLSSLRHGTPGRFFEGGHPLDVAAALKQNIVLEIQDLGDDQDKAFLMGAVIIRLYEHLRMRERLHAVGEEPLRHVTVIEEAHRLLRGSAIEGHASHAVELFGSLLAEVRAYGEGIVVAEQIPSKIVSDVIKNTSIKIMHRLPARDDRETVGATMNLTEEQSRFMVTVEPGLAAVFTDGMDYPALVRMDNGEDRESEEKLSRAVPLAGRFSAACGAQCQRGACTLRQMRRAQHALEEDSEMVLWSELVVVAHIVGLPSPTPGPDLRARLAELDERTRECALAHALERAVVVRAPGFSRRYSAAALAAHTAAVQSAQLAGQPVPCSDSAHWRWQAGPYRWTHIRQELELWRRAGETGPHPHAKQWESDYKVTLSSDTQDGQVAEIAALSARDMGSHQILVFGHETPSQIEISVGANRDAGDWAKAFGIGLDALVFAQDWRWPEGHVTGSAQAAARAR